MDTPIKPNKKGESKPSAVKDLPETGNELTTRKQFSQFSFVEPNNTSFNLLNLIESR